MILNNYGEWEAEGETINEEEDYKEKWFLLHLFLPLNHRQRNYSRLIYM